MLLLSQALYNQNILSLRTGGEIATAIEPIIDPNNLKVEGWYCQDRFSKDKLILLSQDVRDVIKQGIVVDDHDVLTPPDELIRLQRILELEFNLLNKPVITVSKQRLGKVTDFAVEMPTLYIQKLYLTQPLIKSLSGGGLSVDRSNIVEITNRKIVIQDPLQPVKSRAPSPIPIPQ